MEITNKDFVIMGTIPVVQQIAGVSRAAYNALKILIVDIARLIFAGINVSLEERKLNNATLLEIPGQTLRYAQAGLRYEAIKQETHNDLECLGLGLLSCIPVVATIYFGMQWHQQNKYEKYEFIAL